MRPRTILVLAVLVVGLGAFIWFFERKLPSTEERRELEARILPVEVEEIEALVIEDNGHSVRIERLASGTGSLVERAWKVVEPIPAPADVDQVGTLLRQLTELESERAIESVDPGAVGLESPRRRIVLEVGNGRQFVVEVGRRVPATENVVLRLDGTRYVVGSGAFLNTVEDRAGDWRSRDLLAFSDEDVTRVAARGSFGELSIARADGRFVLESPVADDAEADEVTALLSELDELAISDFLDDPAPESDTALRSPELEITLEVDGHEPAVILVGDVADEEQGSRYLKVDERAFVARTELADLLSRPVEAWQSTNWTSLKSFEIDSAIVRHEDGEEIVLERRGGEWFRGEEAISYSDVADLLDAVSGLEGSGVLPVSEVRSDVEADLGIELVGSDRREVLELVSVAEDRIVALREGREYGLVVPAEEAEAVRAAVEGLHGPPSVDRGASSGDSVQESE